MNNYRIECGYSSLREAEKGSKPREKLERLGISALTDKELLMLIIGSGTMRHPVDEISDDLLSTLDTSPAASTEEIMLISGMGRAKASAIAAALEFGRRRSQKKPRTISSPEDVYREVRHYASREQEHLIVVLLNGAHEIIDTFVATIGLLNKTIVHPREVYAEAIRSRAAAIAIAHNHPSGNIEPSADDKDVTVRLGNAGQILGIKLLDHLVFTDERYYSFLEHGLL